LAEFKSRGSDLNDVLRVIAGLQSGDFSKRLSPSQDPILQPIVQGLNDLITTLASQAKVMPKNSTQQNLVEEIIDSTQDWIFIKDREHKYLKVNSGYAKALHLSPADFIGKTDLDLGFPEDLVKGSKEKGIVGFWPLDDQVMGSGKTLVLENDPATIDGKVHIFHTIKTPLRNEQNEVYAVLGFARDITELIELQQKLDRERIKSIQSAKLASMGEMSAGIAHEINNPLSIIDGTVSLLPKFSNDPKKLNDKIEIIKRSCGRISKIITGLKKFSRSGESVNFAPHAVSSLTKEAVALTDAKSKRHLTTVTLECATEALVYCNEIEIEQVLVILINNAIDAVKDLDQKWVRVAVSEAAGGVVLTVTDSGKGLQDHVRNKLFEPFFTTKKVGEGTGLGLSIAKGILDEHRATIAVLPDVPNTCFEVRFPKAKTALGS